MTDVSTPTATGPAADAAPGQATSVRHRARFHRLAVSSVERLTDEAVAVTFAVPEDLVDEFVFEPGQHLTLRAEIRGEDVRQSYSICQSRRADPAGRSLRVAAARVPEGHVELAQRRRLARRRRRGHDPAGVVHVP